MRPSLADSIQVLISSLSPMLVSETSANKLIDMARTLPPIVNGLIECRLGTDNREADLSQHILDINSEPDILMNHIIKSGLSHYSAWLRIQEFCSQWQEKSSSIYEIVDGIGFELDADCTAWQLPVPSFFLRLQKDGHSIDEKQSALDEGLQILLGRPGPFSWQDILHRCFTFDRAQLIYIGAMLARNSDALRVEFIHQSTESIIPLLKHIGWSGDERKLEALIGQLSDFGAYINLLHVDIASVALPKIGLSFLCRVGLDGKPDWSSLLDHLVEAGLCLPNKRDGVLDWYGFADPTSSNVPWPDHIIAQSLLEPSHLSIFERDISHIKVVYQPGMPLETKAYLRFGHRWIKPEEDLSRANDVL